MTFSIQNKRRIVAAIAILLAGGVGLMGCVKKRGDETAAELSARKRAIYSAQVVTALDGWSDVTAVLENASVVSFPAARATYNASEKALSGVDVIRQRLKEGYPAKDVISVIETTLADIDKAEAAGLLAISSPEARAKYSQTVFSIRFGLNSLRAVLSASKEPSPSDIRAKAREALTTKQQPPPPWWTDAILVVQNVAIRLFEQSRMSATEAWADGDALSVALHAKNRERLSR